MFLLLNSYQTFNMCSICTVYRQNSQSKKGENKKVFSHRQAIVLWIQFNNFLNLTPQFQYIHNFGTIYSPSANNHIYAINFTFYTPSKQWMCKWSHVKRKPHNLNEAKNGKDREERKKNFAKFPFLPSRSFAWHFHWLFTTFSSIKTQHIH